MSHFDSLKFLSQFVVYKLAHHLSVAPSFINADNLMNPSSPHNLSYGKKTYQMKFSNPVLSHHKKKHKIWDFDLRENSWADGKDKKVKRTGIKSDFYLLIGMDKGTPQRLFVIPSQDAPTSHVRISIEGWSKYQEYEV